MSYLSLLDVSSLFQLLVRLHYKDLWNLCKTYNFLYRIICTSHFQESWKEYNITTVNETHPPNLIRYVWNVDRLGGKHGPSYKYYGDNLLAEYNYIQGELDGWITERFHNKMEEQQLYSEGEFIGQITTYSTGTIIIYCYNHSNLYAMNKSYGSDEIVWIQYRSNSLHGKAYKWYVNGAFKAIHNYKNGAEFGLQMKFHENGRKHQEYHVSPTDSKVYNIIVNGPFREWDESGKLIIDKWYVQGHVVNK